MGSTSMLLVQDLPCIKDKTTVGVSRPTFTKTQGSTVGIHCVSSLKSTVHRYPWLPACLAAGWLAGSDQIAS